MSSQRAGVALMDVSFAEIALINTAVFVLAVIKSQLEAVSSLLHTQKPVQG
jgi:hypothetical protein